MSELEENRLLESEFQTISSEPLVGRLNLETDLGTIDLLVNKEAAVRGDNQGETQRQSG